MAYATSNKLELAPAPTDDSQGERDAVRMEGETLRRICRTDQNKFRTESLFLETQRKGNKYPPLFTFKDFDAPTGELSMRRKYLEIGDPTEYETAIQLLGDYKHWLVLCERKWFQKHLNQWRAELEVKLASETYHTYKEVASDKNASGRTQAAHKIANREWEKKSAVLRGRPSKEEVAGVRKNLAEEAEVTDQDFERIMNDE